MPFLHPLGADGLRRRDPAQTAAEPAQPVGGTPPAEVRATESAMDVSGPMPEGPSYAWGPEMDSPEPASEPAPEMDDGPDAVPTERMPVPACVPVYPPLSQKKRHSKAWLALPCALALGAAIGYLLYRLGLAPAILSWVRSVADQIGRLFQK
mgnify:CR=1 FL=1